MTSPPINPDRQTTLIDELRKALPSMYAPGLGLHGDPLAEELERLTLRWGAAMSDPRPRPDLFAAVKGALAQGTRGVRNMAPSLLRHVPYALLYGERTGRGDGGAVRAYLERLGEAGSSASRRLWTHYLFSLEYDDLATNEIATWLKLHQASLPERLLLFTRKYEVLDPARTPSKMAMEVLKGDDFVTDVAAIGITLERLRTTALMVAILGSIGILLKEGTNPSDPVRKVIALLEGKTKDPFEQAQTGSEIRKRAIGTFVEGFVAWQRRVDPSDAKLAPVVELLITVNQDPRFSSGRWTNIVAKATTDVVEGWLTRHTIDAFFRVVNRLQIERPDMWEDRRQFWMSYLRYVRRAWLIVGEKGVPYARQEKIRFGRFSGGAFADHCGLVLDFDDLSVLEMNMTGRAILWRPSEVARGGFPKVYDETPYDRRDLTSYVARSEVWSIGCIGLTHGSGWQRKFADQIQQRTSRGIRPPGV
jgi:EH_Signature domain